VLLCREFVCVRRGVCVCAGVSVCVPARRGGPPLSGGVVRAQFRKENGEREFLHRMSTKCEVGDPFVRPSRIRSLVTPFCVTKWPFIM
jgi:hypothetical protein